MRLDRKDVDDMDFGKTWYRKNVRHVIEWTRKLQ
jgi:hypothetical protein